MLALDQDDLQRAFGRPVSSYEIEAIDPHLRIHSVTGGVYRVRSGDDSLVVKIVRHGTDATPDQLWQSGADVSHRNYWKREWLGFDSGLLASLPGRLRAPRPALTVEHADGDCWIWMEDVSGRTGSSLRLDDYAAIARALGSTQGAFASGAVALPNQPWLSRDWLSGWVDLCASFVAATRDDTRWTDKRLDALRPLRSRLLALWSRRDELLAIAAEAPQTLGHWDFWPANIIVTDEDVVAIDWSQLGIGAVCHDLDQLTLDTVWMQVRPDESLDVLDNIVLTSYAEGLRDAGLTVPLDTIWRWYSAAAALRYAWLAGGQVDLLADPERVKSQEARYGREIAAVTATKATAASHALDLGEQVLAG